MARFGLSPMGVDLRRVFITLKTRMNKGVGGHQAGYQ
jgi:hypothetical protein